MHNFNIRDVFILIIYFSSIHFFLRSSNASSGIALERRYALPGLNHDAYVSQGDVNIGAFMTITDSARDLVCTKMLRVDFWVLQYMEAVAFAVELINNDRTLLPNVSLGYVILDYCRSSNIALAQSLTFLPMQVVNVSNNESVYGVADEELNASDHEASVKISKKSIDSSAKSATSSAEVVPHYDVVGVLSPQGSTTTIAVSSLLSVAKIPVVSYMATSDELSSLSDHPYFMRLVPPDKHQTLAMLTFISEHGWSYISVVYGDTSYGRSAFYNIQQFGSQFKICVATSQSVNTKSDFDIILGNLLRHNKARVVILFADTDATLLLFAACERSGVKGHFVWIGSDGISDKAILKGQYLKTFHGAFTFMYYSKRVPQFENHFRNLRPGQNRNPWFNIYWEACTKCYFKNESCLSLKYVKMYEEIIISSTVSLAIDSVYTFAHAVHNLLSDTCPGSSGRAARSCVKGDLLLRYMLNSSFDGFTGRIVFDRYGDLIGRYEIRQMVWDNNNKTDTNGQVKLLETPVAYFETSDRRIVTTGSPISWAHLNVYPRVVPLDDGAPESHHPESVCSIPCLHGQYKIQKELPCCWECRMCRDNEIVVNVSTACRTCEKFTWPDEGSNYTSCYPIELSYGSGSVTLTATLVSLAAIAAAGQAVTVSFYIYFREHRVIKAASRELTILQMVAIFVGYITVAMFQARPTNTNCAVVYFMFCLSFTWLYAPMIVKAVRIYRIFISSCKCNRRPPFVSSQSQLLMAGMLILIQVCLCISTYVLYRPSAKIIQSVPTEKFVELSCDMTLPGLASFITYNLFLVAACSALAFKTRQLPDNFNESRFMSMCVSTTLVIWLAFIPTYFTSSREYVRVLLLSAALLINHTVALVFLFVPKVYAVVYVSPGSVSGRRFHTTGSVFTPHIPTVSNRIAPSDTQPA